MATNEYDDLLGSTSSAQSPDEYDALIDQGRAARGQALRKSLFEAIKVNPDQYAAAKQAGAAVGLPAPIAARNMDTVQPKAQLNSYDALLDTSPKLAASLSDPEFAKVAHDDTSNAGVLEKTLGVLGRAGRSIAAAPYDITKGILGIPEFGYRALSDTLDPILPGDHPLGHVADFVQSLRRGQQGAGDFVQGDIRGAGRVEKDVLGGLRSAAQMAPAVIAGAVTGQPELTMGIITAQTGGEAASSALDKGLSTSQAGTYAMSQATNAYLFGKLPLHGLLGDLANGSGFAKTLGHNLATMLPAVEGQTLVGNLIDWANLNPDKSFMEFAREQPAALADSLVQAATMSVATVGGAHAINRVSQRFAGKMDAANQATEDGRTFEGLTQTAADSKIRARDPESFRQFVEAANADGPVQDVYIDGKTLLSTLEQAKVRPEQLSPSIKDQVAQAAASGGDVRIPLGEYSSQIAGQDYAQALLPHLRTSPEAMSSAQAQEFYQSHEADFKAEAEKQMAEQQDNSAFHMSAAKVEGTVLDQLTKANRFTPDVNKAYASMTKDFYATQADKLGITPEEMYQRYPLNIKADISGAKGDVTLDQGSKLGDNSKDYGKQLVEELTRDLGLGDTARGGPGATGSGGSRRGEAAGATSKVFRGSDRALEQSHFGPEALGKASGNPSSGLGVYFSTSRSDAAKYGPIVSEHQLALQNPKTIKVEDFPAFDSLGEAQKFAKQLRAQGHDGIVMDSSHLGGPKHFIVFDPVSVESSKTLYQEARGQISFGSDLTKGANLTLLKNADLSTFLHESGHFFLEVYNDIAGRADAPAPIKRDFDTVMKWFGTTDADWRSMTIDQKRNFHEQFARGFESYLFEGKAPSVEMQGVFQRFRSWMLNVYKSLSNLNVNLTDEVRGVFGRMLASENQIHAAEAARSYAPVFETAKQARMTPDEWASYQKLGAEATQDAIQGLEKRSLRNMQWLSNAKSAVLKDLQRDAAEKRKAVRDEVSKEVQSQPVYAAQRFIRHGDLAPEDLNNAQRKVAEQAGMVGSKMSLPALKEMYGDDPAAPWRYLKKGKYGDVATEGGMHPDKLAELFGFGSGDEMVRKMIAADPVREVVEAGTDQRMLERYGDLTDPADMARAADREVHNEARARFVATELNALNKATGKPKVLRAAAKEFAAETIARTKVRDVKPAQFTAAEGRAAKAAEKAIKSGKLIEAATEKRNQLVNVYAARAAMDAVREIDSGVKYLSKFNKESTRKALGAEYSDQIDQLLERFDLRKSTTSKAMDKRKSLQKWIEAQEANGFEPVLSDAVRNDAYRVSYKELPVEQFRGLVDSVRNVEHLGRLKEKLLTAQDGREFAAAVADAKTAIDANAKRTIPDVLEHNSVSQKLKAGVNEFFAMHRKFASLIREMDGFKDGGPLWELFVRPMNRAGDHEAIAREKATVALSEVFKPVLKEGHMRDKMYIGAIDKSLSREGRLSIALNWGNETNRQRVMEGDRWTPDQVHAILDTLSKSDWDFVQKVWDHVDSYWPQIKAKEERVTGLAPQKVEASPVITKHGEYKGGYYPIKYDPARSSRSESDSLAESLKDAMRGLYTRATTRRGHIQERVESVDRPMRKDIGVVFEHVNQVIHDLSWHEYLIDANRLLRAGAVDQAVREHYGAESIRLMRSALDDVARGEIPAQSAFERSVNYVRTGATTAGLGWSLSTALLQPIGLTQSMVRIGPGWVAKGLSRWIAGAARMEHTVQMVNDKSEFMRLRAKTMQREINEIRNKVSGDTLGPVKQSFFYLIQKLQLVADMPTWLGQYEKSMATHGDEAKAIAESDQSVIDAQGSGHLKDLAQIQRGGPLMKLWTNFYSFFSTTYNLSVESVDRTNFKKPGDIGLLAVDFFLLYSLPAGLSSLLHGALQGQDWDKILPQLARDQVAYLANSMVGIREISGAISGYADYNGPAGARIITELSKLITDVEKGTYNESAARAANNAAGILFHYPAGQVDRTARGIAALANGDTSNPGVLITGPQAKK